ncbi:MAG TPA: hypothetical protein PL045_09640 [Chitinophagaceae bacterium]|nr:hypothetical protein [Chitinophagaceae bacterium]
MKKSFGNYKDPNENEKAENAPETTVTDGSNASAEDVATEE